MFTKLIKILIWGRCKSCGAALTSGKYLEISLGDLSEINKKAAWQTAMAHKGLLIPDGAFIPVCDNCIDILMGIWENKKEKKYEDQISINSSRKESVAEMEKLKEE